ncbi:hypothetical protein CC80DRAFT_544821 [Byssothecium circinans]|uniref:Uncharacterized protein n=1 Tax=Byssothecium circinans TaxID=147558 RepID=A0A6A5U8Q7_9PLEO|nr:hypothetical protein CC80DRAFT_544821 [Byssothecium circinans]
MTKAHAQIPLYRTYKATAKKTSPKADLLNSLQKAKSLPSSQERLLNANSLTEPLQDKPSHTNRFPKLDQSSTSQELPQPPPSPRALFTSGADPPAS